MVEKRLPTLVLRVAQFQRQERAALRFDRRSDQFHVRLVRRASTLADIALHAATDDVRPACLAPATARHDVVETQLARREATPAVLTAIAVPGEDIAAVVKSPIRDLSRKCRGNRKFAILNKL